MFASVFSIFVMMRSGTGTQWAVVSFILQQVGFLVCLLFGENFFLLSHSPQTERSSCKLSFGNITHTASIGLVFASDFLSLCFLGIKP